MRTLDDIIVNGYLNVTGATTLATSLTGILKATSGLVSVASAADLTNRAISDVVSIGASGNTDWLFIGSHSMTDLGDTYVFEVNLTGGDWYDNGYSQYVFDSFGKNAGTTAYGIRRVITTWKNASSEIYANLQWKVFRNNTTNVYEIYVRGNTVDFFHLGADVKILKQSSGLYRNYTASTATIPSTGYTEQTVTLSESPVRMLTDKIFLRNFSLARDTAFDFTNTTHAGTVEYDGTMFNIRQKVEFADSTTSASSIKIKTGVAPTTPGSGDIWFDGSYLYLRNGTGTRNIVITPGLTSSYIPKASATGAILADSIITDDGITVNVGNGTITNPKIKIQHNTGVAGGSELILNAAGGAGDSNSGKIYWGNQFRNIGTTEPRWKWQRFDGTNWNTIFDTPSATNTSLDLTFYGQLALNLFTSSKALISNGSKQITESTVTSTELAFVSGVTSSIQTQLNGKQDTLTNPVTGTGVAGQVAYFNGTSTIIGDAGFNTTQVSGITRQLSIGDYSTVNDVFMSVRQTSGQLAGFLMNDSAQNRRWTTAIAGTDYRIGRWTNSSTKIDDPFIITAGSAGPITIGGSSNSPTTFTGAIFGTSATFSSLTLDRVVTVGTSGLLVSDGGIYTTKTSNVTRSLTIGVGTTVGAPIQIIMDGIAAQSKLIRARTGSVHRWAFGADATAESGANAGSDFTIEASSDAGALIDSPVGIIRAAGGAMTVRRPLTLTSTLSGTSATFSGLTSGRVTFAGASGLLSDNSNLTWTTSGGNFLIVGTNIAVPSYVNVNSGTGQQAGIAFNSNGFDRWKLRKNASDNLELLYLDTAGIGVDSPFTISASGGGTFTIVRPLQLSTLTANRVVVTDASKILVSSATTDTQIGYLSTLTSNVQTQLGWKKFYIGVYRNPATLAYEATMSYSAATRQLSLSANTTVYLSSSAGAPTTINSGVVVTHANVTGTYYIYLDSAGAVNSSTNTWNLLVDVPLAIIYYNATQVSGICSDARHTHDRNIVAHKQHKLSIGTFCNPYPGIGSYTLTPTTPADAHNQYSLSTFTVWDADVGVVQSTIAAAGTKQVFYRLGATGVWTLGNLDAFAFQRGTYIQYNQYTGATYQLTDLATGEFVNYFIYGTTSVSAGNAIVVVPSVNKYATLPLAKAETYDVAQNMLTFPLKDYVLMFCVTYGTSSGYTNTGKCRIEAVQAYTGGSSGSSASLGDGITQAFADATYIIKAGDTGIGSLTMGGSSQIVWNYDVTPTTSANTNYISAPLRIQRQSTSGTTVTTGIGFHNVNVNAAFLYYDPATGVFKYNRNTAGSLVTIWDDSNLVNPITGTGTSGNIPKFTGTSTIGNGLLNDIGTEVYQSSGVHRLYSPNLTDVVFALTRGTFASHDTASAFAMRMDGLLEWGPGGATARDTNLYRSAANTLKSDDNFEALTIKKTGGTSSQFLKADGSVDSNTYLINYAQLTGAVDFNSILSGARALVSFTSSSTLTNNPPGTSGTGGQGALWQDFGANTGDWRTQLYINAQSDYLQFRTMTATATWRSWHNVWHDGNFNPLNSLYGHTADTTGFNYDQIGYITFPGTGLTTFAGTIEVFTQDMGYLTGGIKYYIDLRRNTNSFPSGDVFASVSTLCRVNTDDLIFLATTAATTSDLVVYIYKKCLAGGFEGYSYNIDSTKISYFTKNANPALTTALPTATWTYTSSSQLAGTGTRATVVSSTGILSAQDSSTFRSTIGAQATLTNPVTGTGTSGIIPKFTGTTTIANSNLSDSGTLLTYTSASASPGIMIFAQAASMSSGNSNAIFVGKGPSSLQSGGIAWVQGATDSASYLSLESYSANSPIWIKGTSLNIPTDVNIGTNGGPYKLLKIHSSNNLALLVGDDAGFGDCNVPHTLRLISNTGTTEAYIQFAGNTSASITDGGNFGYNGTDFVANKKLNVPNLNISSLSPSQLVMTDASKNLVSTTSLSSITYAGNPYIEIEYNTFGQTSNYGIYLNGSASALVGIASRGMITAVFDKDFNLVSTGAFTGGTKVYDIYGTQSLWDTWKTEVSALAAGYFVMCYSYDAIQEPTPTTKDFLRSIGSTEISEMTSGQIRRGFAFIIMTKSFGIIETCGRKHGNAPNATTDASRGRIKAYKSNLYNTFDFSHILDGATNGTSPNIKSSRFGRLTVGRNTGSNSLDVRNIDVLDVAFNKNKSSLLVDGNATIGGILNIDGTFGYIGDVSPFITPALMMENKLVMYITPTGSCGGGSNDVMIGSYAGSAALTYFGSSAGLTTPGYVNNLFIDADNSVNIGTLDVSTVFIGKANSSNLMYFTGDIYGNYGSYGLSTLREFDYVGANSIIANSIVSAPTISGTIVSGTNLSGGSFTVSSATDVVTSTVSFVTITSAGTVTLPTPTVGRIIILTGADASSTTNLISPGTGKSIVYVNASGTRNVVSGTATLDIFRNRTIILIGFSTTEWRIAGTFA